MLTERPDPGITKLSQAQVKLSLNSKNSSTLKKIVAYFGNFYFNA